jgi:hypothetical protein
MPFRALILTIVMLIVIREVLIRQLALDNIYNTIGNTFIVQSKTYLVIISLSKSQLRTHNRV